MCFLKHLKTSSPVSSWPASTAHLEKTDSDTEINPDSEVYSIIAKKQEFSPKADNDNFLMNCLRLMNFNSQMMISLEQKLKVSQYTLSEAESCLNSQEGQISQNPSRKVVKIQENVPEKVEQNLDSTSDSLTPKLFGNNHHYKYRLVLAETFPQVLYKERNFGVGVRLIDISSGKEKRNGNLINICLGVCNTEGEWIHQTKEGAAFIKGKVETELYHGEGGFIKLSPKDVSRSFPNKLINLVVYPKPTLLKYSGESSLQENIDFQQIEPLVIKDVSVKAKKRQ